MYTNGISVRFERMARYALIGLILQSYQVVAANAQQDTAHKMTPGMKMPGQQTKAPPKTTGAKTATKKAAARSQPTKKPTTTTKPKARVTKPPRDTMHMQMQVHDTSHAKMRDTTHAHVKDTTHAHAMPDTSHMKKDTTHMQMRDTAHAHMPDSAMKMRDTAHMHMPDTAHAQMRDTMRMAMSDTMPMSMTMTGTLGISMERMGSGTTWIPDALMLPSRHFMAGNWMVMVHGFVFGQYDSQSGPRGGNQLGSLNWGMIMADRQFHRGRLQLRFMPSLDAATVGKCGYPLLLQSGETCSGQPLVDRQHPHDLFMELGALLEREMSSKVAGFAYAAPAGEPALGPVAFMHRPSAMDEPQVPLGHHWQDATHISFGVITAGVFTRTLRLEASAFNGHEPDEYRWNFDRLALNSVSGRLTLNPNEQWSFTGGYGYIDTPERTNPGESLHRLVLSALHGVRLSDDGQWATTLLFGANKHLGETWSKSALIETEAVLDRRNTLFGRAELVQKSAEELQLSSFAAEQLFNVKGLSVGYIRELARGTDVTIGVGARGTVNFVPNQLESAYGSRTPVGGMVFLRLRPYHSPHDATMKMAGDRHEHSK
jgi:hypothetical protein